jgi:hypothetical protein
MPSGHTRINLAEVEDAAPANGFGARWEARVAREDLDAEQTGVTYFRSAGHALSFRASPQAGRGGVRNVWRERAGQARR